ncbi:MAG: response regulator [Alphaproteobacteria bacterium]|nr:response regulator [Alphaproteobacteria bacterium]MBT7943164.1 response regulator [Alphaproteobacteria bacterium]
MTTDGKNILVIEDDEAAAELMEMLLMSVGYRVTVAHSAEDALVGFSDAGYHLVVTDLNMPGMGGAEGIIEFRKLTPEVPVIVVSASYRAMSPEEAARAAKEIGATAVLAKPFEFDDLTGLVADVLGRP